MRVEALRNSYQWIQNYLSSPNFSGDTADFWHLLIGEMSVLGKTDWIRIQIDDGKLFETHRENEYKRMIRRKILDGHVLQKRLGLLRKTARKDGAVLSYELEHRSVDSLDLWASDLKSLTIVPFSGSHSVAGVIEIYSKSVIGEKTRKLYEGLPKYLSVTTEQAYEVSARIEHKDFSPRIIPERMEDVFLSDTLLRLKREIAEILKDILGHFQHPFNVIFLLPYYNKGANDPSFFQYFLDDEHEAAIAERELHGGRSGALQKGRSYRFKLGQGICGRIAYTKTPLFLPNWSETIARPEFNYDLDFLEGFEKPFLCEDWLYSVPVIWKNKVICVVQTGGAARGPGREERRSIFRVVSHRAAVIRMAMELDQKQREIKTEKKMRSLSTFHSHNISKAFIQPLLNQSAVLAGFQEELRSATSRRKFEDNIKFVRFVVNKLDTAFSFLRDFQVARTAELKLENVNLRTLLEREILPLAGCRIDMKAFSERESSYRKHIELDFSKVPPDLVFRAHGTQIVQTLFTVIDNSIEALPASLLHSDPSRGVIKVIANIRDRFIQIRIVDRGTGIAKDHQGVLSDHLAAVAERRAEALAPEEKKLTTKGGAHLGLGLHCAAVYLSFLANSHGRGKIGVRSSEGKGTTVSIRVPLIEECSISL